MSWFGEKNGIRDFEAHNVVVAVGWGKSSLNQERVTRTPGIEERYGKAKSRPVNGGGLQPVESIAWLIIGGGGVAFWFIEKPVTCPLVSIEFRIETLAGEVALWGND